MIRVTKTFENDHNPRWEKVVTLPEAGTTGYTFPIDLGEHRFEANDALVEIHVDATAAAAGKSITLKPEHSANNVDFTAAPLLGGIVVTGAAGGGTGAVTLSQNCPFPADIQQYLRLAVTVDADAGVLAGSVAYVALVPQPAQIG
jgi:hypothetical protein